MYCRQTGVQIKSIKSYYIYVTRAKLKRGTMSSRFTNARRSNPSTLASLAAIPSSITAAGQYVIAVIGMSGYLFLVKSASKVACNV